MDLSIESHNRKYNLSFCDIALFFGTGFSGISYAKRHWDLSERGGTLQIWGHRIVAIMEALPLIGGLVALIERLVFDIISNQLLKNSPKIPIPPIYSGMAQLTLDDLQKLHTYLDKYDLTAPEKEDLLIKIHQLNLFRKPFHSIASSEGFERIVLHTFINVKDPLPYFERIIRSSTTLDRSVDGKNTLLLWLIANGKFETALKVIEFASHNDHLNVRDIDWRLNSPLHLIIAKGYTTRTFDGEQLTVSSLHLLQAVLDRGGNPNFQNSQGNTPLHLAYLRRNQEMITLLLQAGADNTIRNQSGQLPQDLQGLTFVVAEEILTRTAMPHAPPF